VSKTAVFCSSLIAFVALLVVSAGRADNAVTAAAATPAAAPAGTMPAVDRVNATPKGQLKNPYQDDNAEAVEAGRKAYFGAGCNGCHGGNGGGGMCPALTNDTWVYGGDDDTLFRLVSLGTEELQSKGYVRKGHENVVGPMPPMGAIVGKDDNLWHILAFIRSNYRGTPECKFGCPPEAAEPTTEFKNPSF
jgi:mono/diheme cytochrome c family protein